MGLYGIECSCFYTQKSTTNFNEIDSVLDLSLAVFSRHYADEWKWFWAGNVNKDTPRHTEFKIWERNEVECERLDKKQFPVYRCIRRRTASIAWREFNCISLFGIWNQPIDHRHSFGLSTRNDSKMWKLYTEFQLNGVDVIVCKTHSINGIKLNRRPRIEQEIFCWIRFVFFVSFFGTWVRWLQLHSPENIRIQNKTNIWRKARDRPLGIAVCVWSRCL